MSRFAANLLLALLWTALTGRSRLVDLLTGFVLGYLMLRISQIGRPGTYFGKLWVAARFSVFFLAVMVRSALQVAHDALTPRHRMCPAVIALPLDARTPAEITILAYLISLTPGSLAIEISDDHRILYVHAMYVHDLEQTRRWLKDTFERRVLELLR